MADASSPTAPVILGMLAWGPKSGYEIKQAVDSSARFIWAASYGQIYPELKRLGEQGLIVGEGSSTGGRSRTVYSLTDAGREALRGWLAAPSESFEMRDEALLRLLFTGAAPETAPGTLADKLAYHDRVRARLERIGEQKGVTGYARMALEYGIECHAWMADWCRRKLAAETGG